MKKTRNRPVYLNLFQIRMPVTAVLSFAHRVSGVLLFLMIPVLIYLLDLSLQGPQGYAHANSIINGWGFKITGVLVVWAFAHHLLAGVRFLLIDLAIGVEKEIARKSAWLVHGATFLIFLVTALALLL